MWCDPKVETHDTIAQITADTRYPSLPNESALEIDAPFGGISDHGPGVFIAAGAGSTPFIPILEKHAAAGKMNCTLVVTNATEADVILREKWEKMDGLTTLFTVTEDTDTDELVNEERVN